MPGDVYYNILYFAEADENEELIVQENENSAVKWWFFEGILNILRI